MADLVPREAPGPPTESHDPQALVFGISDGQVGRRVHAGTELTDLQNTGRWQSPSMPARCSRGQKASRGAVARYYGVDG